MSFDEFRLLKLFPVLSSEDRRPRYEFEKVRLSDRPNFEVLSFVRDEGRDWVPLTSETNKTYQQWDKNLRLALESIASTSEEPRFLFIHEICFQELDPNEELLYHEYSLTEIISRIIAASHQSLVWLATGPSEIKKAFDCLEALAADAPRYGVHSWSDSETPVMPFEDKVFDQLPHIVQALDLEDMYESEWLGHLPIFCDIVAADDVVICAHSCQLRFEDFVKATAVLKRFISSQGRTKSLLHDLELAPATSLVKAWQMVSSPQHAETHNLSSRIKGLLYFLYHSPESSERRNCNWHVALTKLFGEAYTKFITIYFRANEIRTDSEFVEFCIDNDAYEIFACSEVPKSLPDSRSQRLWERRNDPTLNWGSFATMTEPMSFMTRWEAGKGLKSFLTRWRDGIGLNTKVKVHKEEFDLTATNIRATLVDVIKSGIVVIEPSTNSTDDSLRQAAIHLPEVKAMYLSSLKDLEYGTGEERQTAFIRTLTLDLDPVSGRSLANDSGILSAMVFGRPSVKADVWKDLLKQWHKFETDCQEWREADTSTRANWRFSPFAETMVKRLKTRQFFVTEKSHIGLAPWFALPGDQIAVIAGAESPFVIRSTDRIGCYQIISDCYLHGFMHGELLTKDLKSQLQTIEFCF